MLWRLMAPYLDKDLKSAISNSLLSHFLAFLFGYRLCYEWPSVWAGFVFSTVVLRVTEYICTFLDSNYWNIVIAYP